MTSRPAARNAALREHANDWIALARENMEREYPHMPWIIANSAEDYVLHRTNHPTFYGSFDWHSCVEMFWVAARLMRLVPGTEAEPAARATIDALLTPENIAVEAAYIRDAAHAGFERPYGWGWLLALSHELRQSTDAQALRWAETLEPLVDAIVARFLAWLPKVTYPHRTGMHANTAFGMLLALDAAEDRFPALRERFAERADAWFGADEAYPAAYEPSGADFLSAGLCEAVLMSRVLPADAFPDWLTRFLPGLATSEPRSLFTPAEVSDGTDGHIAHLHGLNLSRAWAFLSLAQALPAEDARRAPLEAAAELHAAAAMPHVSGSDYMVEHWLSAYATLYLSIATPLIQPIEMCPIDKF